MFDPWCGCLSSHSLLVQSPFWVFLNFFQPINQLYIILYYIYDKQLKKSEYPWIFPRFCHGFPIKTEKKMEALGVPPGDPCPHRRWWPRWSLAYMYIYLCSDTTKSYKIYELVVGDRNFQNILGGSTLRNMLEESITSGACCHCGLRSDLPVDALCAVVSDFGNPTLHGL